jgi:hypothetical protein
MGFIYGCRIIDPLYSISAGGAALRGALVAFFSYVLFITLYGVIVLTNFLKAASLSDAAGIIVLVFVVGFILVGWLLLIIGAVAGWLLFRVSRKDPASFLNLPRVNVRTSNQWIIMAILLFLSNCAGVLFLVKPGQN